VGVRRQEEALREAHIFFFLNNLTLTSVSSETKILIAIRDVLIIDSREILESE
jgi:hypothetical protein